MKRITDFRVGELRIPAERFPLPPRVAQMLRLYSGPGRWESNVAVFFLPVYRLAEIEVAMREELEDVAAKTTRGA
jgi:hypothetical protein